MLTSAKNETVKFRDDREIYQCTRKRQGCTRERHASGRGSPPSQPSQLLHLHSLRSADTNNAPSNLCGGERLEGVATVGECGVREKESKAPVSQLADAKVNSGSRKAVLASNYN